MDRGTAVIDRTDAPAQDDPDTLDVRTLPPPQPLTETLERTADLAPGEAIVQYNDRAPQHLYPKLGDRGLAYETVDGAALDGLEGELDGAVATVIWRPAADG